jgi:hypothetical protein
MQGEHERVLLSAGGIGGAGEPCGEPTVCADTKEVMVVRDAFGLGEILQPDLAAEAFTDSLNIHALLEGHQRGCAEAGIFQMICGERMLAKQSHGCAFRRWLGEERSMRRLHGEGFTWLKKT